MHVSLTCASVSFFLPGDTLQGSKSVLFDSTCTWTNFTRSTESVNKAELSELCFLRLRYNHYQMSEQRRESRERKRWCVCV